MNLGYLTSRTQATINKTALSATTYNRTSVHPTLVYLNRKHSLESHILDEGWRHCSSRAGIRDGEGGGDMKR